MMRNNIKIYLSLAVAALAAMACHSVMDIQETPDMPAFDGDGIVLKLDVGKMDINTRVDAGTRPGDDDGDFNENVLGTAVDVFFFPEGATDASQSTMSVRVTAPPLNSDLESFIQIPTTVSKLTTIFGSTAPDSKCVVFVVANYNGAQFDHENGSYTLGSLKALPLAVADWSTFPQEKFVMTGQSEITLVDASLSTPASGEVRMKRVASKVTFKLTVADTIVVVNTTTDQSGNITKKELEKWTPLRDAMTVYLQYGMKYARLGGVPQSVPANPKSSGATDSLYTYQPHKLKPQIGDNGDTLKLTRNRTFVDGIVHHNPPQAGQEEWEVIEHQGTADVPLYKTMTADLSTDGPFYTYPVKWEPGVQTEPFLKLIIPWNNGSRTKYYYYKIPFSTEELISNNWYEITLDVQILGGENEQPIPLEAQYKVVEWVPGSTTPASVVAARYLSVPKTEWIMYNTNELTIPITSSHDVQIVGYTVKGNGTAVNNAFAAADKYTNGAPRAGAWIGSNPSVYNPFTINLIEDGVTNQTTVGTIYATRPNYNANTSGNPAPYNISTAASWFPTAEITRDQIVLRHTLNNDTSTNDYDVAPYYIRIRVRHKDDYSYYKDIIIEQRPAIVIEPQQNSAPSNQHGYVWIDNSYDSNTTWKKYTSASSGTNHNTNMYVISTSVLPASSTSVLGDPRSTTAKTDGQLVNNWDSTDGPYVGGNGNRDLTYYYQTDNTTEAENTIAPSFRVASSHGQTSTMSYNDALRRCASYQEDGRPAGRWRIPTKAEILYITTLSTDGKIPALFTFSATAALDESYWCSNGKVDGVYGKPTYYSGTSGERYVRCVYDEWFWENTTYATVDKTAFRWGDQTRESVVRTKAAE